MHVGVCTYDMLLSPFMKNMRRGFLPYYIFFHPNGDTQEGNRKSDERPCWKNNFKISEFLKNKQNVSFFKKYKSIVKPCQKNNTTTL